ncbi:FAD-binding oxidoreductase [Brachybacterium sp. EF45031]|uniref:FAD-binding and (Fe-S)-binding domain-containing protein n=1 Tax=Brachybacterium sillae TaxID=2810536 RepID=UPI00217DB2FB|nr:FAD-binding and (Fe-S)-binding domain-containing protein [Brachybacterium sillae]MCS6712037.1 FAD-binding oxidoreductase [Brachybacterium sillae]
MSAPAPSLLDRDIVARQALAPDASPYLLIPEAVARPRDEAAVVRLMREATAQRRPLTFRSGGTSLAGQAQSASTLADVRRGFRQVEVLDGGRRVRTGPGATLREVNAHLAQHGRRLGPDPASEAACTIGGVIANNSSGMAAGTTQTAYRTLASLRFVLPSGTIVDTGDPRADAALREAEPALHEGLARLVREVRADADSVQVIRKRFALKNTMGYALNALLDFDTPAEVLAHLVVGSEGTLAFVSSAVFDTVVVEPEAAASLLVFDSLSTATGALGEVLATDPATIELLDARSLQVAQALPTAPQELHGLRTDGRAALLVEHRAGDRESLEALIARARTLEAQLGGVRVDPTTDPRRRAALWSARKGLYAAVAGARRPGTTALLEDVVVPVERLEAACRGLQQLFDTHGYDDSVIFGHAKDGNIHFLLTEQLHAGGDRLEAFTEQMVELVLGHGGNLKAEHGTGRAMAPFVERQYGPRLTAVMRRLKELVDPAGILNPGVVLTQDPALHTRDLKPTVSVEEEVDRCVECGYCEPVCPSRDLTLTPRQRIGLRRALQRAEADGDAATAEAIRAAYPYQGVQTCAVDSLCAVACPLGIDTGDLVRRLRAEAAGPVVQRGWALAAEHWGAVTGGASVALTAAGAVRQVPVLGAVPGLVTRAARAVAGEEAVPDYRPELPRHGGARRGEAGRGDARRGAGRRAAAPHGAGRRAAAPHGAGRDAETAVVAVHLRACVHTMFGPADACSPGQGAHDGCACTGSGHDGRSDASSLGLGGSRARGAAAALEVLAARAGVGLTEPPGAADLCCGTPFSSKGMTVAKNRMRSRLREALVEASRGGELPVVVDAASCTEGVRDTLDGTGLRVIDAATFAREVLLERLPVTTPVGSVTVHPTCSTTHLGSTEDVLALARACVADPERDVVVPVAWGCCGYAGDRGMLHPELTASATASEAAEVARRETEWYVSANRTCELGMTAATGRPYRHILELLEVATRPHSYAE